MDDHKGKLDQSKGDLILQNEEFLKNHKELNLDSGLYHKTTIERIEKSCGCQVICNPHFDGISFYVKNEYYKDAQNIINEIAEKESSREEKLQKKRDAVSRKSKQKFHETLAKCDHPDESERAFAEKCLKTLRLEDYVPAPDAEKYKLIQKRYPEYFKLLGWPDAVEGNSAKEYLNSSFVRGI